MDELIVLCFKQSTWLYYLASTVYELFFQTSKCKWKKKKIHYNGKKINIDCSTTTQLITNNNNNNL